MASLSLRVRHGAMVGLLAGLGCLPAALQAQAPGTTRWADSVSTLIARAMVGNSPAMMDEAVALTDRVLTVTPEDGVMLHYKGYALFRKASLMLGAKAKESDLKAVLEEADDVLEASAAVLKWPETFAVRASVLGQLIGVGGMLAAMRLGPRADKLFEEAVSIDPTNPRVLMLRGVSAMHKPKMFGGGNDKAERDLRKALEIFPTNRPEPPLPSWGHAEAWAWLGQVLAAEKKVDEARQAYQQSLAIEPQNAWVTHVLLPALDSIKR